MIPRGIRNNNPGNIIKSGIEWVGERPGEDSAFETFSHPFYGIRALCGLLLRYYDYHKLTTINGIIHRWAPPSENDTVAYVNAVSSRLGLGKDVDVPLHLPDVLAKFAECIIQHENGQQPYPGAMILEAAKCTLGLPYDKVWVEGSPIEVKAPVEPKESNMPAPILALLQLAGTLIPAIGALFPQQSEVAKRNVAVAGLVSDALVKAVGAASPESPPPVNLQAAVEKLDDPAILQRTSAALSSDPTLTALVEVGGGVDAARKAVAAYSPKDGDAWYVIIIKTVFNPVVMISAAFIPALYKMVDALISRISDVSPDVVAQSYGTVLGFIGMVAAFWFGLTWAQRNIQRSDNNHGA